MPAKYGPIWWPVLNKPPKNPIELMVSKTDAFATQISVEGDLELLQFALGKLVYNAIAAAPEGSRIECASGDATRGSFILK